MCFTATELAWLHVSCIEAGNSASKLPLAHKLLWLASAIAMLVAVVAKLNDTGQAWRCASTQQMWLGCAPCALKMKVLHPSWHTRQQMRLTSAVAAIVAAAATLLFFPGRACHGSHGYYPSNWPWHRLRIT